ncbi:MAG TPA: DUF5691 domain-containing protein [Acidimicrobiia bacterium]|nr:DUF5691 domain-containing protein [Acidimicrobiia bacterium]
MTAPANSPPAAAPAGSSWESLLAAALIGTARRPPSADVLLAEAAVLSAYRRAGRLPGEAPRNLPAPAPPDDRPPCSPTAVEVLELVLSGQVPIPGGVALLAGQWLEGAARVGCRVPARLLPRLLELGSANPALQAALRTVIGPRGRWLAGHDDRWGWAGREPVDDLEAAAQRFATAGKAERPAILEAVRRADATRGRDLLSSTWKSDPAAERAALLVVLAVGLSDGDEPFLEAALDDRSAGVRQVAVDLLARLPASRRAARMAARLQALVTRGRTLSFAPPGEPDAGARRDGINDASPAGMGASAWRLVQLVAGAPLSFWSEHVGLSAAETVALSAADSPPTGRRGTSPAGPLLLGLESAVVAQASRANSDWAVAVFAHRPSAAVLAAMPADLAAEQLTRLLGGGLGPGPAVAEVFAACPGPWPESLGRAVLDRYRQLGARATLELQAALPVLAARLDPAALPLVETWVVALADDQGLRRRVQTLGHALSLRAVIQREFPS